MKRGALVTGQSGGATAVINATLAGIVAAGQTSGVFEQIIGFRNGLDGLLQRRYVDLTHLSHATLALLRQTPSAALGTSRHHASDDDLDLALEHLRLLGATVFVLTGGNDSADTAHRLHGRARDLGDPLRIILAPKTVDNDLAETDHCPGYGSIARFLANAVRDATYDTLAAPALAPVKFIDVMGRDAGWVTAATSLAFTDTERDILPTLFFPERPPASVDAMLVEIEGLVADRGWVVAVVPETLRDENGVHLAGGKPTHVDPFGHPYHEPPAVVLTRLVTEKLGLRARFDRPGSASRMSISLASPVDLAEAYKVGQTAVQLALDGESDRMVRIIRVAEHPYRSVMGTVPLDRIANLHRPFPDLFIGASGRSTSSAFRRYAMPLLGDDPFPPYTRLLDVAPPQWQ